MAVVDGKILKASEDGQPQTLPAPPDGVLERAAVDDRGVVAAAMVETDGEGPHSPPRRSTRPWGAGEAACSVHTAASGPMDHTLSSAALPPTRAGCHRQVTASGSRSASPTSGRFKRQRDR